MESLLKLIIAVILLKVVFDLICKGIKMLFVKTSKFFIKLLKGIISNIVSLCWYLITRKKVTLVCPFSNKKNIIRDFDIVLSAYDIKKSILSKNIASNKLTKVRGYLKANVRDYEHDGKFDDNIDEIITMLSAKDMKMEYLKHIQMNLL